MRNRAKCKLCKSILESCHDFDFISCTCGEISISGGNTKLECSAKDWANFLRVDDNGNEIIVKVQERDMPESEETAPSQAMTRKECIEMFETMLKNIENLPQHAMSNPINHYDFYNYLMVVLNIFQREDK